MYTRTIRSAKAILPLFITFTLATSTAFSQNYHHKFTVDSSFQTMLDSADLHLQVSLRRVDNENMKFRLSALNPSSKFMNITILKGDDVFYNQSVRQDLYDYVFDLSSLEDGNYQLMVSNGKEKISKNILIQTATHVDRELTVH
jgi:hypothetical protein